MAEAERQQSDPDAIVRIGGWLFRQRTWIPAPLIAMLLLVRFGEAPPNPMLTVFGAGMVAAGELFRLWGVHQIGAISRTRSDRVGELIATGPFAYVRNPLYLGNMSIWIGFAVIARLMWMVPVIVLALGFEYHAIVRWEERLLESRLGDRYREYAARVPRWIPSSTRRHGADIAAGGSTRESAEADSAGGSAYSWRATFFSERGTLIAIAVGFGLLYVKLRS